MIALVQMFFVSSGKERKKNCDYDGDIAISTADNMPNEQIIDVIVLCTETSKPQTVIKHCSQN